MNAGGGLSLVAAAAAAAVDYDGFDDFGAYGFLDFGTVVVGVAGNIDCCSITVVDVDVDSADDGCSRLDAAAAAAAVAMGVR